MKGKFYSSLRKYINVTGNIPNLSRCPSIHVTGSIKGMRKQYWGKECDIVRCGLYYYAIRRKGGNT